MLHDSRSRGERRKSLSTTAPPKAIAVDSDKPWHRTGLRCAHSNGAWDEGAGSTDGEEDDLADFKVVELDGDVARDIGFELTLLNPSSGTRMARLP